MAGRHPDRCGGVLAPGAEDAALDGLGRHGAVQRVRGLQQLVAQTVQVQRSSALIFFDILEK